MKVKKTTIKAEKEKNAQRHRIPNDFNTLCSWSHSFSNIKSKNTNEKEEEKKVLVNVNTLAVKDPCKNLIVSLHDCIFQAFATHISHFKFHNVLKTRNL